MKRTITITLLAAALAPGIYHTGWHDAGLLTMKVSNYGLFGSENAGIWPRGTAESYIFGAGIWVGAVQPDTVVTELDGGVDSLATIIPVVSTAGFDTVRGIIRIDDELILYRHASPQSFDSCVRGFAASRRAPHSSGDAATLMLARVSVGYDPSTGNSELAPGELPNEPGYTDTLDRVYFSDNPADTALWPLREPGGAKVIVSNEDSYGVANDLAGGTPLGIKIIQRGYAWYYHYYEDFIFLTYLVVNTSETDTLRDLFAGVCCDADVGDATDDLVSSDAGRNLGYAWDSNFSEPGWAHVPGYVGFDFLESPQGPAGQLGLTAFKILKNPGSSQPGVPDPANDFEAYLTLAGYDHPTGNYHPVDTLVEATDARFTQCTGPFALGPGDTGRVVIAVIYGADSTDLRGNSDLAQRLYDAGFITHRAWVLSPNGGGSLAGDVTITWRDSSCTGAPLLADIACSRDRGRTWQDIATGVPSSGSHLWHTTGFPDGTRYLVRVTVYDTVAVGEDVSDSVFTLNNPGNGPPDIEYLAPHNGTVRGECRVQWWARDPDADPLAIDVLLSANGVDWDTVATGLANTGSHWFNTARFHNGSYYLMVRASDADTSVFDRSGATVEFINDHRPAGRVVHTVGGCNGLSIQTLLYDTARINNHYYEVTFNPVVKNPAAAEPRYRCDLRDLTAGTLLLDDFPLDVIADGTLQTFFTPVIDGFALEFDAQLSRASYRYTDYFVHENASGFDGNLVMQGADSAGTAPPLLGYEWCFRGSNYSVRWVRAANDSLTLEVYDSTACAEIPYLNGRGDGWFFGAGTSGSRYYNRTTHRAFFLNGGLFWFNRNNEMTVPPGPGDVWAIRAAGHRVPVNNNTWTFRATLAVEDAAASGLVLDRVAPNPFTGRTAISFSAGRPGNVIVTVSDVTGRRLRTLAAGTLAPGHHRVEWDGRADNGARLAAGVYFISIEGEGGVARRKVTLVR